MYECELTRPPSQHRLLTLERKRWSTGISRFLPHSPRTIWWRRKHNIGRNPDNSFWGGQ